MSGTTSTFAELQKRLMGRPLSGRGTLALSVTTPNFFVPPRFDVIEAAEQAPVLLLSARGAAGKSTTAAELSRVLDVPVWRLEEDNTVSSALVSWVLAKHLDTMDWLDALPEMGAPLLIVDSLDEARARVSMSSWTEFLGALSDAVKAGLRLVLLGRTLTLEDIGAQLESDGIGVAWYEVSHFDSDAQVDFVDRRAETGKHPIDVELQTYRSARDAVLNALRAPLEDERSAERFVGYPPVLEAIVALLKIQRNHQAVASEFEAPSGASRAAMLFDILDRIVAREQEKLDQVAIDMGVLPRAVYTPREQAGWLLHALEGAVEPTLDHLADEGQRLRYIEETAEFRDDHPFRSESQWASPVFQAYVLTKMFAEAPISALQRAGEASGLLFELMSVASHDRLEIDELQFAALQRSLLSGQRHAAEAAASIGEDESTFEGVLSLGEGRENSAVVQFVLRPTNSDSLVLQGPLSNLTVDVTCDVLVRSGTNDVVLGPDLSISARSILIEGANAAFVRRELGDDDDAVFLGVEGDIVLPPVITPPTPRTTALEIESPAPLAYPWTDYRIVGDYEPLPNIDPRVLRFLDKLMDLTRSHGHRGPRATFFHKLKGRQALKGETLRVALDVLTAEGVIYESGDMIFYSQDWVDYRYYSKSGGGFAGSPHIAVWTPIMERITNSI